MSDGRMTERGLRPMCASARAADAKDMQDLSEAIARGEYEIDPHAVAEAIIARRGERWVANVVLSEVLVAAQAADRPAGKPDSLPREGTTQAT
jgi:Anti-sigma-28 factor, FlgM